MNKTLIIIGIVILLIGGAILYYFLAWSADSTSPLTPPALLNVHTPLIPPMLPPALPGE